MASTVTSVCDLSVRDQNPGLVVTWTQFLEHVSQEAGRVPPQTSANANGDNMRPCADHRVYAALLLFQELSAQEQTAVYMNAMRRHQLVLRGGLRITQETVCDYAAEERCGSETEAFIHLAAWGVPDLLDAAADAAERASWATRANL